MSTTFNLSALGFILIFQFLSGHHAHAQDLTSGIEYLSNTTEAYSVALARPRYFGNACIKDAHRPRHSLDFNRAISLDYFLSWFYNDVSAKNRGDLSLNYFFSNHSYPYAKNLRWVESIQIEKTNNHTAHVYLSTGLSNFLGVQYWPIKLSYVTPVNSSYYSNDALILNLFFEGPNGKPIQNLSLQIVQTPSSNGVMKILSGLAYQNVEWLDYSSPNMTDTYCNKGIAFSSAYRR